MSAFKDTVAKDVKAVFLNLDEFAEIHTVNGNEVSCVVDKDLTKEEQQRFEGVFVNSVTIYVADGEMEVRPVEGELLELDETRYIVRSVSAEGGVLVIVAEVNEQ